jgi:pimeloyl-ACP methyl ester carboxylesterase
MKQVTSRFMVASGGTFVGPSSSEKSSFRDPDPGLLQAPTATFSPTPVPRTVPSDHPSVPAGDKIIIYIHGGGSRAEEAVDMANWFIIEGRAVGEDYTVISFDLPNSAYGATFDVTEVVGPSYDHSQLFVLQFEQQYIIAFIEALDTLIGNVKDRIVAVMGGSLGGNTSLLMTDWYDANHPYLQTIVSWSVTATAPSDYLGIISGGDIAAYLSGLQSAATSSEDFDDHATEANYIQTMYSVPLSKNPLLPIPPQPIMWYRGGYAPDGRGNWQPCKDESVARSRFDRYEIYSPFERHWTTAIDLEQISFSFQDNRPHLSAVATPASPGLPASNLMLVAGDNDNFFPNAIYNSTIDLARSIRMSGQGKAEFWLDTGHSIHNERPRLFAREIIYFLTHPAAGDSPNGTVVSTPPKADYSMTDR